MPYTDAAAAPVGEALPDYDLDNYTFRVELWRAKIRDLRMFDPENPVGNIKMLDFVARVIRDIRAGGQAVEDVEELPYPVLSKIFQAIGEAMKAANNAGN